MLSYKGSKHPNSEFKTNLFFSFKLTSSYYKVSIISIEWSHRKYRMTYVKSLQNTLVASLGCAFLLSAAHADQALRMQLTANQVTINDAGKVIYTPVSTAPKGSVIQYKATYSNIINKDIKDLTVVLPIPANMTFTGEASPASAQASIDGKNYADMPLLRKVDSKLMKIPYSEYRTLRWDIKLLPAQKSAAVALNTIIE